MKKLVLFWICIVGLSMTGCRAGQQEIERNNAAESTVGQQPEEPAPEEATEAELQSREQIMEESVGYTNLQQITLDSTWEYADHSKIKEPQYSTRRRRNPDAKASSSASMPDTGRRAARR